MILRHVRADAPAPPEAAPRVVDDRPYRGWDHLLVPRLRVPFGGLAGGRAFGGLLLAGGDRIIRVSDELAAAFGPGDRLAVVGEDVLHIPAAESAVAAAAVGAASEAFSRMGTVTDAQVTAFFEAFANVYRAGFDARAEAATGGAVEKTNTIYPNIHDGVEGMYFIEQSVASSKADGAWLPLKHPLARR
jgi:hypothetical protein